MRSLFVGFTTRGRAFLAAGLAASVLGLGLGQRALISVGALLVLLPLLAAIAASRTRYQVRCLRQISPGRVPAGEPVTVEIRIDNVSRLPTGLLLAEESVPYVLGTRPRFVLDRIEPGGWREFAYQLQSDHRGKFAVGPLHVRVADVFGLVRLDSSAAASGSLIVTPAITALPRTSLGAFWLGAGGSRASVAASVGDDDVVPRPYRDGDELRRVHWRSTARHGELMVRREEQHWRSRVVLFLDTRACAHGGRGPSSSFEAAVSAAASIGTHLAREGVDGQFFTETGAISAPGSSLEDTLLEALAVIRPSRSTSLDFGLGSIPRGDAGLLIAVVGDLPAPQAERLAAARRDGPAMALLLDVSTWSAQRLPAAGAGADEAGVGAAILERSGWRVATLTAATPLAAAWARLAHPVGAAATPTAGRGG